MVLRCAAGAFRTRRVVANCLGSATAPARFRVVSAGHPRSQGNFAQPCHPGATGPRQSVFPARGRRSAFVRRGLSPSGRLRPRAIARRTHGGRAPLLQRCFGDFLHDAEPPRAFPRFRRGVPGPQSAEHRGCADLDPRSSLRSGPRGSRGSGGRFAHAGFGKSRLLRAQLSRASHGNPPGSRRRPPRPRRPALPEKCFRSGENRRALHARGRRVARPLGFPPRFAPRCPRSGPMRAPRPCGRGQCHRHALGRRPGHPPVQRPHHPVLSRRSGKTSHPAHVVAR